MPAAYGDICDAAKTGGVALWGSSPRGSRDRSAMSIEKHTLAQSSIAGIAALACAASPAAAQDISADPTYETVRLSAGFTPDPYTVDLSSGGSIDAETLSGQCRGYIANSPDVRLIYEEGSGVLPLIIKVESDADTTLVVNAPNGSWYCDDDTGDRLNPLMRFEDPDGGRYEIWVGTYSDSSLQDATLSFSELDSTISSYPDTSLDPTYGSVSLASGFTPDPHTVKLRSGGSVDASNLGDSCRGYVASAPDYRVNYDGGSLPLIISANADVDVTLVVNDPNGNWVCDDDSGEGLNPSLRFEKPLSGQYDVWVGTYSDTSNENATLSVSELYSE